MFEKFKKTFDNKKNNLKYDIQAGFGLENDIEINSERIKLYQFINDLIAPVEAEIDEEIAKQVDLCVDHTWYDSKKNFFSDNTNLQLLKNSILNMKYNHVVMDDLKLKYLSALTAAKMKIIDMKKNKIIVIYIGTINYVIGNNSYHAFDGFDIINSGESFYKVKELIKTKKLTAEINLQNLNRTK